jgi:BR serine/threonine kinase
MDGPVYEPHIGPYIPVRTLGEGTTGKVKLAFHKDTNENVAIKIILKSSFEKKPDLEAKVQREIALMRLTNHPNIMKLKDYFESPRHLYIILEYAQQGELFDYLISKRVLPVEQAIEFFRQIIFAIEYLHEHGICHRDLKPENILLDSNTRIKIADFGFARWVKSNIADTACGSPHYAAPEVISGRSYDGRKADIWSCGVVFFALLAGYLPFDDASIRTLLHKVKRGVFQMPAFPAEIKDIIQRMLTVDPEKRITIAEIKQHPCFRQSLNSEYLLPKPMPFIHTAPVDISQVDPKYIDSLIKIGFTNEELAEELAVEENTMAKVFLTMLMQKMDLDAIPWDTADSYAVSSPSILSSASIMNAVKVSNFTLNPLDPFQRKKVIPPESVSLGQMSYAKQGMWPIDDSPDFLSESSFETFGVPLWQAMFNIQQLFTQMGMQWFHPDPQNIIARNEDSNLYVSIECLFRTSEDVTVTAKLRRGDFDAFNLLAESIRSALGVVA